METELEEMLMKNRVRRVGSLATGMIAAGIVAMLAGAAGAAPMVIGLGDFSGSETVLDFSGLAPGTPITTQYAAQGVTFSGQDGNELTANFAEQGQNFALFSNTGYPITIDFSSTMLRTGFDVRTLDIDNLFVTVTAISGGNVVSSTDFEFQTGTTFSFAGIEDSMNGIDQLVLSAAGGSGTNSFIIDNFRFEAGAAVVPEPSAALLFPAGLLLAATVVRRRRAA
jgi:hypothetical protein